MKVILNELPDIVKDTVMIQNLIEDGETEGEFEDRFVLNKDIIVNGEVKLRNLDDLENFVNVANYFGCEIPLSVYKFSHTCEIAPRDPNIFEGRKREEKRNKQRTDFFNKFNREIPVVISLYLLLNNSSRYPMSNKFEYRNIPIFMRCILKYNLVNFYMYINQTSHKKIIDVCKDKDKYISFSLTQHNILLYAIKYKRFDFMKQLLCDGFDIKHVIIDISKSDNFEMLKYLFKENLINIQYLQKILNHSSTDLNVNLFRFIMDNCGIINSDHIAKFVDKNWLDILKVLHEEYNFQFESRNLHFYGEYNPKIFKYLVNNGAKIDRDIYCMIITHDASDLFEYAIGHTIVYDTDICACAAYFGRLEYLKILREKNVPWNGKTLACAMRYLHYDCVKWLIENGCEWDERFGRMFLDHEDDEEIEWY